MPLFRRKKDANAVPAGAPAIPGLNLPSNQSILSLAGAHNFGVDDVQSRTAAVQTKTEAANGDAKAKAAGSADRKYDTVNDVSSVQKAEQQSAVGAGQSTGERLGHRSTPSSLSRSMSSGAVPYHLPWTRQLARDQDGDTTAASSPQMQDQPSGAVRPSSSQATQPSESIVARHKTPPRRATGDSAVQQSSSMYSVSSLAGLYSPSTDFRTSPSAFMQPSPSQRRHVIDSARQMSLKRSKAPSELNIMVVGAQGTGKTSFIRALLATCDLSLCTDETKTAAALFGIAADHGHATYDTDPITPLRTAQVDVLSGIDLHPSSLIPIAVLESGAAFSGPDVARPHSIFSSGRHSSSTTGQSTGRLQLSICDTPGIDFEIEDEFEVERKVTSYVRHIEQRLQKTLQEEAKVQRSQRGGSHIHLVLYFIDPRFMLQRIEARKARRDKARYAFARAAAALSAKEEEKRKSATAAAAASQGDAGRRMRSTSLSHHAAVKLNNAANAASGSNATLSKQAQTAQLRESMDAIQAARLSLTGTKRADGGVSLAKDLDSSRPTTADAIAVTNTEEEEHGVEALTQQQLSALSRLSERANVLPVIAKADTLTQAQLEEVRTAVRDSIARANIDLGAFEVEGTKRRRKPYETYRPSHTNGSSARGSRDDVISPTPDASEDRTMTPGASPVKVIRIKSRRSYSATGERFAASNSGHSMLGHDADINAAEDGQSAMGHTNPLFDGPVAASVIDEDDMDDVPAPEILSKMMPFAVFAPEPVRVRARQSTSQGRLTPGGGGGGLTIGGPQRKGSMNSIAEHLPPVPPLPRELSNMKKHKAQQSSISTTGGEIDSSAGDHAEAQEVLQNVGSQPLPPRTSDSPTDAPPAQIPVSATQDSIDQRNGRTSVDGGVTSAVVPQAPPPPASRRFRRDFRYGHANVLDSRHCDFALLRTCMLGSHVDQLRESTAQRYEKFRQQKLELSRLTRQGK